MDIPEIAEALKKILRNPSFQKELGKAGRKYVIANFGIDAATDKTLAVYNNVLRKDDKK